MVKAPVDAMPLPIAPGAANVAPPRLLAFKLATLVVDVTVRGAVPVAIVDVSTVPVIAPPPVMALPPIAILPPMVHPANAQSNEAWPVNDAVIVPAEKLPLLSRATIVEFVFVLTASVAIVIGAEPL